VPLEEVLIICQALQFFIYYISKRGDYCHLRNYILLMWTSLPPYRMFCAYAVVFLLISIHSARSLQISPVPQHQPVLDQQVQAPLALSGDWMAAKAALRNPDCCVVAVLGLEPQLRSLQAQLLDDGPADLDLRMRVRCHSSTQRQEDCLRVRRAVSASSSFVLGDDDDEEESREFDPCTAAIEELARGFASLADGPKLENTCFDVFVRVVCASDYRAIDPMFHTDKAPLRGYVTLCGVGTDYMTRTCTPMEYLALRSGLGNGVPANSVRRAKELEFIVMKGDHYECAPPADTTVPASAAHASSWLTKLWRRTSACVHRSPPAGTTMGETMRPRRRVIVSLDLADGDDDREWYQAGKKREWRNGLTQRKSRLVA
jgi:hypothetical protein